MAVFMLREWAPIRSLSETLKIIKNNGFLIIREKILLERQAEASELLRGGSWGQNPDGTNDGWLPAIALVVIDKNCVKMPPAYAKGYERFKIRKLKKTLRSEFDEGEKGAVHSTDNSHESWEYIDICFPKEVAQIREEFNTLAKVSVFSKLFQFLSFSYIKHSLLFSLREFV